MVEQLLIRNLKCLGAIAAAVVCTAAAPSPQQPTTVPAGTATIAGFVFDETTDRPVEGAEVEIRLSSATKTFSMSAKVDSKGHFEFAKVPEGSYSVLVHARSYDGSCYGFKDKAAIAVSSGSVSMR